MLKYLLILGCILLSFFAVIIVIYVTFQLVMLIKCSIDDYCIRKSQKILDKFSLDSRIDDIKERGLQE